jgi:two-component system response regulator DegU
VDDHPIVREGLRSVLLKDSSLLLVGEAECSGQALELARQHQPHVALVDINLPDESGLETTRRLREELPDVKVIVLTVHESDTYLVEAMRAGAAGYLVKGSAHGLVLLALQAARRGGLVLPQSLVESLLARSPQTAPGPAVPLKPRERDILQLLVRGKNNRAIAEQLSLAHVTVKKHIQGLMVKLGASDRTQVAVIALRGRLVD